MIAFILLDQALKCNPTMTVIVLSTLPFAHDYDDR